MLVDGDPLVDITATRRIRKVWRGGVACDRAAFVGSPAEDEQLATLDAGGGADGHDRAAVAGALAGGAPGASGGSRNLGPRE